VTSERHRRRGEPGRLIEALRHHLSRLSRTSLRINENLDSARSLAGARYGWLTLLPRPTNQILLDPVCRYLFLNLTQSPQMLLPEYPSPGKTSHTCIIHTFSVDVITFEGYASHHTEPNSTRRHHT